MKEKLQELKDQGLSNTQIGEILGVHRTTIGK